MTAGQFYITRDFIIKYSYYLTQKDSVQPCNVLKTHLNEIVRSHSSFTTRQESSYREKVNTFRCCKIVRSAALKGLKEFRISYTVICYYNKSFLVCLKTESCIHAFNMLSRAHVVH